MSNLSNGLGVIATLEINLEELGKKIPREHRGVHFERILENFHPQKNTCQMERGFAEEWAEENIRNDRLGKLLSTGEDDPRRGAAPRTKREWEVAYFVAATLIQWLPTSIGTSFLRCAFRRSGGSMTYTMPPYRP